jgi:hypothetical protein
MTIGYWVIAVAVAAQAVPSEPAGDPQAGAPTKFDVRNVAPEGVVSKSAAEAFIARCGSRKFETTVNSNNKGKLRKAKILLCAKPGETDEQWIATLEKAAAQLEASPELSAEAKSKVAGEIQAAIGQVRGALGAQAQTAVPSRLQTAITPMAPVLTPPPMPSPAPLVSNVPPLPRSPTVAPVRAIASPVAKPRISISCPPPGEPGMASPCSDLASDTLLMIRADEDLKSKVSLRFIRDGDPRGGIALGTMRRGQIVRTRLPSRLCAGVVRGRVELQTVVTDPQTRVEQVADTQGPYLLRC